jgi:uncharacterized ferritin-like protein (DUF455 family)
MIWRCPRVLEKMGLRDLGKCHEAIIENPESTKQVHEILEIIWRRERGLEGIGKNSEAMKQIFALLKIV